MSKSLDPNANPGGFWSTILGPDLIFSWTLIRLFHWPFFHFLYLEGVALRNFAMQDTYGTLFAAIAARFATLKGYNWNRVSFLMHLSHSNRFSKQGFFYRSLGRSFPWVLCSSITCSRVFLLFILSSKVRLQANKVFVCKDVSLHWAF
jgi:hypothetical protein